MNRNPYINLTRIEFPITYNCTSKCKHCSVGEKKSSEHIDTNNAVSIIKELSQIYDIDSIMTFGGEPLLYADTTCAIHNTAKESGIPCLQIITNGYFSNDTEKVFAVAKRLKECGVNSLLLSVDAFHHEFIPLEKVYPFAKAVCENEIEGFKLHPAWVVNRAHENQYNKETEKCLKYFENLNIPISDGNNVFPAGNAVKYLSEYYERAPFDINIKCGEAKYTSRLDNVDTISINPNGDVIVCCFTIGNIYDENIRDIITQYNPYKKPLMTALLNGGVSELLEYAQNQGINVDVTKHYSACGVCREIVKIMRDL